MLYRYKSEDLLTLLGVRAPALTPERANRLHNRAVPIYGHDRVSIANDRAKKVIQENCIDKRGTMPGPVIKSK